MVMALDIFNAEDWLGNRDLLDDNFYKDSAMSKIRRHKVRGSWLFIQSDCGYGIEVEAYFLDTIHGECYDAWPSKGFSWSAASLAKKIEELEA